MPNLKDAKVAILATNGFEQSELLDPRKALDEAGAKTVLVSPETGSIRAWMHKEWGKEIPVDKQLDDVKAEGFDALLLPGGVMNPDNLRTNPKAVEFVKHFFDAKKPVAAICHGPWMVVETGGAKGRRMTSWPSLRTDIQNAGGIWVDEEAVEDGNLITSRKPDDIPAFNQKFLARLEKHKNAPTRTAA